jgi:hydrogenase maturation protein HypF
MSLATPTSPLVPMDDGSAPHASALPARPVRARVRIRVRGTVQGVGFRPFVHRIAQRHGLTGFVLNDDDGVLLEAEGATAQLDGFLLALRTEAPAASHVESIDVEPVAAGADRGFVIRKSTPRHGGTVPVSPDLATCNDCWREFRDPEDRRFQYPFLNCTQCGPRFTIIQDVPYDRARTTMRAFTMCEACAQEYHDPTSRRFHAEPNACPTCGPSLQWYAPGGDEVIARRAEALSHALAVVQRGGVIAVKGIGGYHLVCDATNAEAVDTLRRRKHRPDKPLAILVADLETIQRFATVTAGAARALRSPAHPIVLVPHHPSSPIAPNVAPGIDTIGVMLPSLPLHAMLAAFGPLVCTSGNLSDEPIAWRDEEARLRLAPLVDGVLSHDRVIEVPCDDSVVQLGTDDRERPIRRSRGYAPMPMERPPGTWARSAVLAVGAELKATIGILQGSRCMLSSHIGDVANPETLNALDHATHHLLRLHDAHPDRIACDLHPGYLSAMWASQEAARRKLPLIRVQHHHAHLASLMGEHGLPLDTSLLAFTFDGTGYGSDGTIWGGEALLGGYRSFRRLASITPFPLAGGDVAVRQPWRSARGLLHALAIPVSEATVLDAWLASLSPAARRTLDVQLERGISCATTTSMGRFLDACAMLMGGHATVSYEGQGAIALEAAAHAYIAEHDPTPLVGRYAMPVMRAETSMESQAPMYRWELQGIVRSLLADVRAQTLPVGAMAWALHASLAAALRALAVETRASHGVSTVGLTGGVFQNRLLSLLAREALEFEGFGVLEHHRIPCNDGGLALGQALIAAATDLSSPSGVSSW